MLALTIIQHNGPQKKKFLHSIVDGIRFISELKSKIVQVNTAIYPNEYHNLPITFASSSVRVLLRKIFFTRRVFPEGRTTPVVGIGGSPSFCCKLSAITRKTLRPIFILLIQKEGSIY